MSRRPVHSVSFVLMSSVALCAAGAFANSIGTVAAVNRDMNGTPPSAERRSLDLGTTLVRNERVETSEIGSGQLVFADQTTLTVAPNTDIVLDEYVYDPDAQAGSISISLTKGALRFIGGRITKGRDAVIRTPTATIGIRGGLCIIRVSDAGATQVIQIAGEYTQVVDAGGTKVTLSRPNATAQVEKGGDVEFTGLATSEDLGEAYGEFEGDGDGGSETAKQQGGGGETEQRVAKVSSVNSNVEGGERHKPVSTSGEKEADTPKDAEKVEPNEEVVIAKESGGPEDTASDQGGSEGGDVVVGGEGGGGGTGGGTDGGTDPGTDGGTDGGVTDGGGSVPPSAGGFFLPSTGRGAFNSVATGSLIGTTGGGQTIRIPVPASPGEFTSVIGGQTAQPFFAANFNPEVGFFEFGPGDGAVGPGGGEITGVGFSDLLNNFHLVEFDTLGSEHGFVVFGDPSPLQASVMVEDFGSFPPDTNSAGVYVIEPELSDPLGGGGPPGGVIVIANGGEGRFTHASTGLPANGGRVLVGEVEIAPFAGIQESGFSILAGRISGSATGGLSFGAKVFDSTVAGLFREIGTSNVGTFEDQDGNTVFGPNDDYIVVSSLHRPGGVGGYVFDPGQSHEIGASPVPDEPFVGLLTHDPGGNQIVSDPLRLANDATSRFLTIDGSFDAVFANGFAACSTGNCGAQFSSSAFSGVYALESQGPFQNRIEFDFGQFDGIDRNAMGAVFSVDDVGFLSNIDGATAAEPFDFFTPTIGDGSAYLDDDRFGFHHEGPLGTAGIASFGTFALAGSGLTGDGGVIPTTAGPPPEFVRWGWWSAAFDTIDATGRFPREDLIHLGTWVGGVLPDPADMPTTGIASYSGFAVGTDADLSTGATAVVGGDFAMTYDFGSSSGNFALNIAGSSFSAVPVFGVDNEYSGFDSAGGLEVTGAFMSGGGSAVAATGGQFKIDDFAGNRQVLGVYGGDAN